MNFEQLILEAIEGIAIVEFDTVIRLVAVAYLFFWLMVVGWIWGDISERTKNWFIIFLSVALVLMFNIFGLLVYFLIRPKTTIEEVYWADLERRYLKYETYELKDCPDCGYQLRPGFNVCPKCGYKIRIECSNCGVAVDKGWQYCPFCKQRQMQVATSKLEGKKFSVSVQSVVVKSATSTPIVGSNDEELVLQEDSADDELTEAEMEEVVEKTRQEVVDTVEKRKTRYALKSGLEEEVRKLWSFLRKSIVRGQKSFVSTGIKGRAGVQALSAWVLKKRVNPSDQSAAVIKSSETKKSEKSVAVIKKSPETKKSEKSVAVIKSPETKKSGKLEKTKGSEKSTKAVKSSKSKSKTESGGNKK